MSGRSSLPTQWRRWPADKMHQASTLERGLVMVYLRSTLKKTHWLGHWTSRSQGGKKKQFDHISIDTGAPFFFYVSRATSDPARQWCTVPHVAKLNVISPNVSKWDARQVKELKIITVKHLYNDINDNISKNNNSNNNDNNNNNNNYNNNNNNNNNNSKSYSRVNIIAIKTIPTTTTAVTTFATRIQ